MNIILSCYYGFTGKINFENLHKDYFNMSDLQKSIFEADIKKTLSEAGLFITSENKTGIEFILGAKLKEEILVDNGISTLNISDYLFLLNQGKSKADTDAIFKEVNRVLCEKDCYYFNPQKYSYLTYSKIYTP